MPVGYRLIGYVMPEAEAILSRGRPDEWTCLVKTPDKVYSRPAYVLDELAPAPAEPIKRGPTDRFPQDPNKHPADDAAQVHVEHARMDDDGGCLAHVAAGALALA